MNKRSAHSGLLSLVVFLLSALACTLGPSAFAQGATRKSGSETLGLKNEERPNKDRPGKHRPSKERPDLRDRWMMQGRTAPPGQSAAELRLRAHQQKMAMRRATATRQAAAELTGAESAPSPVYGLSTDNSQSSTPWVALGPAPLISDQNLYGAVSGRVTAVAIDPTDATGNTVYIGAAAGGVWHSTNAATGTATNVSWIPLTDQQPSLVNGAVSVKPDGTVVLAGTGEPDSAIDSYYGIGILRSTNQGGTWTLIPSADNGTNSFAGLGFSKFAWDTATSTTVIAATGTTTQGFADGDITSATNRGLYYSSDAGQTWSFQIPQDSGVALNPASISATDVVYNATAGKFFAAIRYHGLYSSTNGQNWTRLANQPNPASLSTANCPAQIPPAGSTCPIYRGQLSVVPGREEMYFWFVSLTTQSGDVDVIDEGIWRSLDGGNSWVQIDETGIANCGDPGNNGCGVELGYYNLEIAAVPDGQATDLYAGAVNLFKCMLTSNGTTCSTLDPNYPNQWINLTHVYGCSSIASVHPDQHGLDFMLVNGAVIMYFATDGGIYRTLDGFTQLDSGTCQVPNGFDNLNSSSVQNGTIGSLSQFVSFSLNPTDQSTVLGGTQGNGSPATSSATGNLEWSTVNGGDGGYNAINAWTPTLWYTSNPYVNIYACPSGINCTTDNFLLTVGSNEVGGDTGAYYTAYILDPQDPDQIIVGTCRVWSGPPAVPPSPLSALSVDFDTLGTNTCTGDEVNLVRGLDAGGPQNGFISTTVYATTEGTGPNATSPSGGEIWVTTNAGITPMIQITGNTNPLSYTISSVAVDLSDKTGGTAYVSVMGFLGTGTHIWQTNNAGATWTPFGSLATGLPDAPVNALLVDPQAHNLYAGTDVGVFMSPTTAANWVEVGTAPQPGGASGYLPNVPVSAIRLFNYDGTKKLRVSTYGRGVWEYALAIAPDYTNAISNSPQTIYPAQNATFNGTLTAIDGYASPVNLSCTGSPPSTCALSPTQVTPTATGAPYTLTAAGAVGDYTFSAQAVGTDPKQITHDATVTLHVVDFNISTPNPDALTVTQGGTSNPSTFLVTASGSFSGTVFLTCPMGLPSGAACQFSPSNAVSPTAGNPVTVTLSVTAATGTPAGGPTTVTLAANVAGAPAAKNQTFALTVTAPAPDFALAVTASPASTVAGTNLAWSGSLTALHGYDSTVNLSCTGDAPLTCAINPPSLVPTANGAAFTVTVGSATAGAFNFNIQGTDGTLTHTQAVSLAVGTDVSWTDTGSATVTVEAGQSATYNFSAVPVGGAAFTSTITFACTNLPTLTACSFTPASISAGAGTTPVALTISTIGPYVAGAVRRARPSAPVEGRGRRQSEKAGSSRSPLLWLLTLPAAGILVAGFTKNDAHARGILVGSCLLLACSLILISCGGALGGGGGGAQPVTISPPSASVPTGGAQQFTANQAVTWGVTGGNINGTISANGLYTAPATVPDPATITVTATSAAQGATPGSATVTITKPEVTVTVSPFSVNLYANQPGNTWAPSATEQQFSATVNNGSSQSVTWAVTGGDANGTIDANGLYTTPVIAPNPATVTVTATSTQAASPGLATVDIQTATAVGTYPNIQVTAAAAGGTAHADVITLTVQ